jgi:hypothetical protein
LSLLLIRRINLYKLICFLKIVEKLISINQN